MRIFKVLGEVFQVALKEFSSPSLGSLEFKGGPVMGSLCFRTDAVRDHFFTERGVIVQVSMKIFLGTRWYSSITL